jgi:hypothetical protein
MLWKRQYKDSNFFKGQTTWQPKRKGCIFPKVCLGEKMGQRENILRKKKIEFVICKLYLENVAKIMGLQKKSTLLYDI